MRVLGLGGSDHDVASCIVEKGKISIAIEDERVSRYKYAIGSNLILGLSRKYCYHALGIKKTDIDKIVVDDILAETAYFGVKNYTKINHHLAHAASSYYPSKFEEAALLVIDNAGSLVEIDGVKGIQTISYGIGQGTKIDLFQTNIGKNYDEARLGSSKRVYQRGDSDDSLGHFYKIVSGSIGFRFFDNNGYYYPEAGKTMGLAPYGDNRYYDCMKEFLKFNDNGVLKANLTDGKLYKMLEQILKDDGQGENEFKCKASIAWACQKLCEESVILSAQYLYDKTKLKKLCYSGGVALNCISNAKILKETPFEEVFVFPACGDNGTAVGCAYYGYFEDGNGKKKDAIFNSPYFGREYSDEEITASFTGKDISLRKSDDVAKEAAQCIADGKIIAWYQGGAELGPRALGHRSILADPRNKDVKDILNYRVKFREGFRPFAPSVLYDKMDQYFEDKVESPYMLLALSIKEEKRKEVPGVVHVDGTARVQTVTKELNGKYADLIEDFEKITGVPIVVNTSFNVKGEPICETPEDAIACFLKTGIDVLFMQDYVITKNIKE